MALHVRDDQPEAAAAGPASPAGMLPASAMAKHLSALAASPASTLGAPPSPRRTRYLTLIKPALDRIGAAIALLVLAPVLVLVALTVRATLGSPVLFRQSRVGLNGRTFTMYKFRTMRPNRRVSQTPWDGCDRRVRHKTPEDPRLVPLGRFLRKWSLDELPQFFNVLNGSMSLVGPRPELVEIVAAYQPWQHARHNVKPGLSGLWQVTKRNAGVMHEHTAVDLLYLEQVSFWRDCRILLLTLPATVGFGLDSSGWRRSRRAEGGGAGAGVS